MENNRADEIILCRVTMYVFEGDNSPQFLSHFIFLNHQVSQQIVLNYTRSGYSRKANDTQSTNLRRKHGSHHVQLAPATLHYLDPAFIFAEVKM